MGIKKDSHAHGGYFERDEEETPLPSAKVDLNALDRKVSSELRKIVGKKTLAPRFGSDIQRTLMTLRFHGADIEVALDEGFLFAGERRESTDEIELELKSGEPVALFDFGLALVDALPLRPSILSKAERAAELLSGKPRGPVSWTAPDLTPDMPTEEAVGALLQNCLSQFLGNLPILERGDPIEAIHQMRVAIRRLRSAFGLVHGGVSPEFDTLRAEFETDWKPSWASARLGRFCSDHPRWTSAGLHEWAGVQQNCQTGTVQSEGCARSGEATRQGRHGGALCAQP